jgi:hypothetical protein
MAWFDYLPDATSWTGLIIYSLLAYLAAMILSMLVAPFMAPTVPEHYKK